MNRARVLQTLAEITWSPAAVQVGALTMDLIDLEIKRTEHRWVGSSWAGARLQHWPRSWGRPGRTRPMGWW